MKVILFGASGMVGQGVLRECLLDQDVDEVLVVGRTAIAPDQKIRQLVRQDFLDLSNAEAALSGFDACFFCLGITSAGMAEPEYTRVTYDIAIAAATTLARLNPAMTFIYVSGSGTDSTERGRVMWARVKGRTENALLRLPFKAAYMFRPAAIQPLHGITSKTRWYRVLYAITRPLLPVLERVFPAYVTTTEQVGLAMLKVAKQGYAKPVLETPDINSL